MSDSTPCLPFVLIDDNRLDLLVTSKLLTLSGLASEVMTLADPAEALELLSDVFGRHPKVMVLLDIQMPRLNGFDFLDQLVFWSEPSRSRFCIIMLSSTLAEEDLQRVEAHPLAMGLLSKPLRIEELKLHLSRLGV